MFRKPFTDRSLIRLSLLPMVCMACLFATGCGGSKKSPDEPPVYEKPHVLVPEASGEQTLGSEDYLLLDISHTDQGYFIAIAPDDGLRRNIKLVSEATGVEYSYFIESGSSAVIPFTDGEGKYKVTCYLQVQDSQYAALFVSDIDVALENVFFPYLYPNQYVDFNEDTEACILSASLLPDDAVDIDCLNVIYDYVTANVVYDEHKAQTVEAGYLPVIDETLHSGTGICFDYAALMTAMLRMRGIPCRLVTGYAGTIKHAWIDVYIRSRGWVEQVISFDGQSWNRMDPTFAAAVDDKEFIRSYIGDGDNYTVQYAH